MYLYCDDDIFYLTFLFGFLLAPRQKAALHVRCPGKNQKLSVPRNLLISPPSTYITWNKRSLVETSSHVDSSGHSL